MLGECFADNGARKPSYEQKQRHHQREQHPPSGCHMPSAALLGYLHFDLPSRRGTGGSPDRAHTVRDARDGRLVPFGASPIASGAAPLGVQAHKATGRPG